ncbi:hypothetical protein EDC01DRAFT_483394 [Geopyxis carbonaria]|nr:hypothetical protein EDC01DRAFT_483394 [Geopyxis carbonaria]
MAVSQRPHTLDNMVWSAGRCYYLPSARRTRPSSCPSGGIRTAHIAALPPPPPLHRRAAAQCILNAYQRPPFIIFACCVCTVASSCVFSRFFLSRKILTDCSTVHPSLGPASSLHRVSKSQTPHCSNRPASILSSPPATLHRPPPYPACRSLARPLYVLVSVCRQTAPRFDSP